MVGGAHHCLCVVVEIPEKDERRDQPSVEFATKGKKLGAHHTELILWLVRNEKIDKRVRASRKERMKRKAKEEMRREARECSARCAGGYSFMVSGSYSVGSGVLGPICVPWRLRGSTS